MEIKKEDFKNETIHLLNYYSKYYCGQYIACEELFENQKGHLALFNLLALFENIMKSTLNDFEDTFYNLNLRLKEKNLINELELKFLNDKKVGIRKIRNILAHANLSKYDLEIIGNEITFPFTENETCLILYKHISTIISGIILKILEPTMTMNYEINTNSQIKKLKFNFITRTPEELMKFKGIEINPEWEKLDEATKYRLVENSSDVNVLTEIFKGLKQ
ncbi:hypothetical protein [Maribacter sp. 6B07]|uniref:hypothetical protein n=1 Tax=Maribacter sp. 6B07 TaxID=2045442 RepID=UPI001180C9F8|nr:hypothetical protein [Maribacter sp. 6B07]